MNMEEILERLSRGEALTREEAYEVMLNIGRGAYPEAQLAAFLMAYRMRAVTAAELAGFREALLLLAVPAGLDDLHLLDVCGTGGDGKNTFNISTLTAFVCAGAGALVAKHGNAAATSAAGSSDLLQHLGYRFSSDPHKLRRELEEAGICYLHAPLFHPALKQVAPVRKALRVKTFFNILGPLVNPARPRSQLAGVFSLEVQDLYRGVLEDAGIDYAVVHSLDGYDEVSLTGETRLLTRRGEERLSPAALGLPACTPDELAGGATVEENARIFLDILHGQSTPARHNVVVANSALALQCYFPGLSRDEALEKARESLDGGRALQTFRKLIDMQP